MHVRAPFFLCLAILAAAVLLASPTAHSATYTWTKAVTAAGATDNWSTGTNWSAVPVSANDTTLSFGYTWTTNTTAVTNNLNNNVANPFLLNVLTLGGASPTAGSGSSVALTNITGSQLSFVSNGGTTPQVNLSQNNSSGQLVSFDVQAPVALTNNTLFTGNGSATFTISGAISGAGTFTKNGTSTLTLSNSSLASGGFTVNAGTLILTGNSNPASGSLTVNSGGTLRIGNNTATQFNSGNYTGDISTGTGGTLQLWSSSAQTFSGNITGAGGINKAYGGALTLSGNNTYTGKSQFLPQTTAGFTVNVSSFDYVTSGSWANHGLGSSLGAPTTTANGTIDVGDGGKQANVTLNYTGAAALGETTDRVINLAFNGTSSQTISANNASGVLRFTSAFTSNTGTSGKLILAGTGAGQIDQGLPQIATGGLDKQGTGTWTLGGSGSFTGPTLITAGILSLNSATALQNSPFSTTSVAGGASAGLQIATTTLTLGGLTGSNALSSRFKTGGGYSGLAALTLNLASGASFSYGADIGTGNGSMSLTKTGLGTQTFTAAQTYTGGTTISGGTLQFGKLVSQPATGAVAVGTGAALAVNVGGAGEWTTGTTNVAGSIGGLLAGTGGQAGGTVTYTGNVTLGFDTTNASPTTQTYSGVIGDVGTTLGIRKLGTNTLVLDQNNTFTGAVTVDAGTLNLSGNNSFSSATINAGSLRLSGDNAMTGAVTVNGNTLTLAHANAVDTATGISLANSATLNLRNNNPTTFAGPLTTWTSSGTSSITINVDRDSANTGNELILNGGLSTTQNHGNVATVNLSGGNGYTLNVPSYTINRGSGGGGGAGHVINATTTVALGSINVATNVGGLLLTLGGTSAGNTAGGITNSGSTLNLAKAGNSTWSITGSGNYTGSTTITAGTLRLGANAPSGSNGALGNATSAVVLGDGSTAASDAPSLLIDGTFTVGRAITVGSVANTNAYNATIGGNNTTGTASFTGNITLNTTATNYTATLRAAPGGTVQFGTGTWTTNNKAIAIGSSGNTGTVRLNNAIATTGGINVNFGTLALNSAFTGNMTVASGATLSGNGSVSGTTGVTSATVNGTGLVLTGLTTFNNSSNILSGTVTATGGVSLAGSAALANSATVTGGIAVGAGTLTGSGGSFSAASTLNGGTINLTSGTFGSTLGVTGGNWNGAGSVTGLVTSSSGTFTIGSGANLTANGDLAVTGGSIAAADTTSTITGSVNYTSGSNSTFAGIIAGSGKTLTLNNASAVLALTGNNTYTGATTVTAGTLVVTGSLASSGVTNNTALVFDSGVAQSYGSNIGGSGTLTKLGAGKLSLNGTNSYAGVTTVSGGTLAINGSITSDLLVDAGATIGGYGTVGGNATIQGIHAPGNSPGIQTFGADLTYSGGNSTVNWELVGNTITNAANPNAVYDQIIVGGNLDFADATALNLTFNGSGSSVLWSDSFWGTNQSWLLFDVAGTTSNTGNFTLNIVDWLDSGTNTLSSIRSGSSFNVSQVGNDLLLNYVVVPEPGTMALLGAGVGFLGFRLARRRRPNR